VTAAEQPGPTQAESRELVTCDACGTAWPDLAADQLAWSAGWEQGRQVHTCPDCARRFLRSIEAKLDSEWW